MDRGTPDHSEPLNRPLEGADAPIEERRGPSLEERTRQLQDSLASLTSRLKSQNRSMAELRRRIREMEGSFGDIRTRAYTSVDAFTAAAKAEAPATHPAIGENLRRLASASRPAEPEAVPEPSTQTQAVCPPPAAPEARSALPPPLPRPPKHGDAAFIRPSLALLLVSAVAYGSATLQDSLTRGVEGLASIRLAGTRPPSRPKPSRAAPRSRPPEPPAEKTGRLRVGLSRRLPSVPEAAPAPAADRRLRKALTMVYSFKPLGWRASVLEVLGSKGPGPLDEGPSVERLDRDLYLITFRTAGRGDSEQVYEFEADVVGETVFARPSTAHRLAYLPSRL